MNAKNNYLIILVISFFPLLSYSKCFDSQFHYIHNKKTVIHKIQKTCTDGKFFISEDCFYSKCILKEKLKKTKLSLSTVGSPHFKACYDIGGLPIIGQLLIDKKLKSVSLCFDSKKQSFVEGAYILSNQFKRK